MGRIKQVCLVFAVDKCYSPIGERILSLLALTSGDPKIMVGDRPGSSSFKKQQKLTVKPSISVGHVLGVHAVRSWHQGRFAPLDRRRLTGRSFLISVVLLFEQRKFKA